MEEFLTQTVARWSEAMTAATGLLGAELMLAVWVIVSGRGLNKLQKQVRDWESDAQNEAAQRVSTAMRRLNGDASDAERCDACAELLRAQQAYTASAGRTARRSGYIQYAAIALLAAAVAYGAAWTAWLSLAPSVRVVAAAALVAALLAQGVVAVLVAIVAWQALHRGPPIPPESAGAAGARTGTASGPPPAITSGKPEAPAVATAATEPAASQTGDKA